MTGFVDGVVVVVVVGFGVVFGVAVCADCAAVDGGFGVAVGVEGAPVAGVGVAGFAGFLGDAGVVGGGWGGIMSGGGV